MLRLLRLERKIGLEQCFYASGKESEDLFSLEAKEESA